jgi:hypothetical protein
VKQHKERLDKMLESHGGFYTFEDILTLIHKGLMQSFAEGDNWVVTQVNTFPRKTVLEIVLVVGDLEALRAMEPRLLEFKEEVGADMIMASGRLGWLRVPSDDWKPVSVNFVRQ